MLAEIKTLYLFLFAHSQTEGDLDEEPYDGSADEREGTHCRHTSKLMEEECHAAAVEQTVSGSRTRDGILGSETYCKGTEDTIHQVNRESTHRVVNLEFVEHHDRNNNQSTGDGADNR